MGPKASVELRWHFGPQGRLESPQQDVSSVTSRHPRVTQGVIIIIIIISSIVLVVISLERLSVLAWQLSARPHTEIGMDENCKS